MRKSRVSRFVAALGVCAGLVTAIGGAPNLAYADSLVATPGAAEAYTTPALDCEFYVCSVAFNFVMAPADGSLQVDWGDGSTDTFAPGTSQFLETHVYDMSISIQSWTLSMSVNGGPATPQVLTCVMGVDYGVCTLGYVNPGLN